MPAIYPGLLPDHGRFPYRPITRRAVPNTFESRQQVIDPLIGVTVKVEQFGHGLEPKLFA